MKDGSKLLFQGHKILSKINSVGYKLNPTSKPDWTKINVVIFVSTGRTGTHFMAHFFDKNFRNTYGIHEPDINIYDLNINYLKGVTDNEQAKLMLDLFRKEINRKLQSEGITNYVESNLEMAFLLPILKDYFPNLKVVHMVRNAKDVVRSYYSREAYGKWVGWAPFMSEKDPRDRLNARIFPDDPFHSKWGEMDRFSKICWYWSKYNQLIEENLKTGIPHIRVSFESLFKEKDLAEWDKLINFLELKDFQIENFDVLKYMTDSRSNEVKTFKIGKFPEWEDQKKEIFKTHCESFMQKYGYEI